MRIFGRSRIARDAAADAGRSQIARDTTSQHRIRAARNIFITIVIGFIVATCVPVVPIVVFGLTAGRGAVIASALMYALAALIAGAILGFLFGVPRAMTPAESATPVTTADDSRETYRGNTNLEEVSDWLTKILLGAGLTQLGNIANGASHLFVAEAAGLGGQPAVAFMGAVNVYFFGHGFVTGWLLTRVFLGGIMSLVGRSLTADEGLKLVEKAKAEQDEGTKNQLLDEASERFKTASRTPFLGSLVQFVQQAAAESGASAPVPVAQPPQEASATETDTPPPADSTRASDGKPPPDAPDK